MTSTARGRRRSGRMLAGVLLVLGLGLGRGVPTARAQEIQTDSQPAFSLERFTLSPGHSPYWAADDADVVPFGAWSVALAASLMSRPIVLQDIYDRTEVSEPVSLRQGLELAVAVGLGARYQLGLAVPVVAFQSGERLQGIGLDETPLARTVMGDLRLHTKLRLLGAPGEPGRALAVSFHSTIPTGNDQHFAGERGVIASLMLIGSWRASWWSAAVNLGARLRTDDVVLLSPARPHGNELVALMAGSAVIPGLPRRALEAAVEVALVRGDSGASSSVRGPSPGEVRGGLRWTFASGWSMGAAVGAGVTPAEVGSPAWRLAAVVRRDLRPVTDLDGDRIADGRDLCRLEPEDRDGFRDIDGCPDPDNDGDGWPDMADDCPNRPEDRDGDRDVDGCPE